MRGGEVVDQIRMEKFLVGRKPWGTSGQTKQQVFTILQNGRKVEPISFHFFLPQQFYLSKVRLYVPMDSNQWLVWKISPKNLKLWKSLIYFFELTVRNLTIWRYLPHFCEYKIPPLLKHNHCFMYYQERKTLPKVVARHNQMLKKKTISKTVNEDMHILESMRYKKWVWNSVCSDIDSVLSFA